MNKWMSLCLSAAVVVMMTACGGSPATETPAAPETKTETPAPAPAVEPAPAPAAEPAPAAAPAADSAVTPEPAAAADPLAGTSWKGPEYTVTFKGNGVCMASGGQLADIAPDGLEATYKIDAAGAVEVSAMGNTFTGTFDGTKLIVDGAEYAKQDAAAPAPAADAAAPAAAPAADAAAPAAAPAAQ